MAPDRGGRPGPGGFEVVNLDEARFECTFGRGCDGICCRNGRPPVSHDEALTIAHVLPVISGGLRPEAQVAIRRRGFLSGGRSRPSSLRVAGGWCVFFNAGCVLHRLDLEEGRPGRYKPAACGLFPLAQDRHGVWFVRQRNRTGERWDLSCLDPDASAVPAAVSLQTEVALARKLDREGRYSGRISAGTASHHRAVETGLPD